MNSYWGVNHGNLVIAIHGEDDDDDGFDSL
jgi:hypothetical protein